MNWLIELLGGVSQENYSRMHGSLGDRFEKEYYKRKRMEDKLTELRRIAIDIASKHNELDVARKISSL